ncbi:hypothetical protein [Anabaena sp. UHCC 0451]|uniref:hypothetical protein n=1 Tax=Anabaena sp. UHCC 0451 TaxID=2055235 RepID=UPI002B21E183|nr:hypothetical protein [Anabaena sp. UHCC 0451]MEA5576280.1 hypothetical protein [Anabaena sp. UHCC 0451]
MTDKNLEALVVKVVKKAIKKEMKKLEEDNLPIVSNEVNQQLQNLPETLANDQKTRTTTEIFDDIYTNSFINLPTKEDVELERRLRELKFKQELRKDWILFILKDVIIYAVTILFMFSFAGFYLFTLIHK